ncbi:hypothetical protein MM326_04620 [Alkalihalobacillus sp. LMS6]|uniref:hypothetical protein n=1 Tax=Alkalihalobacillus sp. LMS6 TaxID=2924034 RepID=UPI0020D1BD0C|nr:hypothetical protein [Alkalihalobacillus sp. LMS6]UTR07320.1 hypothetical protein MM326_04620 [Alkalihalobacillus sp. LMS6]
MTSDKFEMDELNILTDAPIEKVEVLAGKYLYYLQFTNQTDLIDMVAKHTLTNLIVCMDLLVPLKEEFYKAIRSEKYHFPKREKRGLQYVEVWLEEIDLKQSSEFFRFIMFVIELNVFTFIVLNPRGQLHDYLVNDKVRIHLRENEEIVVFDYDGAGAFYFTNKRLSH